MSLTVLWPDDGPDDVAPTPGTLAALAERYFAHMRRRVQADDLDPQSLGRVKFYVGSFLAFIADGALIGSLPIDKARQSHLTAWLVSNFHRWKTGATRADAVGTVLTCFTWLEDQREIEASPFRRPKNLTFTRQHRRAMRPHHFRAIYWAASRKGRATLPFRLMLWACWYAGVRLGEFRKLEPSEVDPDSAARQPVTKNKTGRRTGEGRVIGLGPRLFRVLSRLCEKARAEGRQFVFATRKGKAWSKDHLGRQFARFRKLAGVPEDIKMCATRHGFAYRLLADPEGRTQPKAVADALGHHGTRMVESIYAAETRHDAELVKAVARNAERLGRR